MSLDYDAAYAAAREGSPFSNSTEYGFWAARWCERCAHDAEMRTGDDGPGCPLVLVGLLGKTPAEWQPRHDIRDYTCTEFLPDA